LRILTGGEYEDFKKGEGDLCNPRKYPRTQYNERR